MKNTYLTLRCLFFLALFVLPFSVKSQSFADYSFSVIPDGVYTYLRQPNKILTGVDASITDGEVFNNVDIGFDFYYLGQRFTKVSVSGKGFLVLGQQLTSSHKDNSFTNTTLRNMVAPLWDDLTKLTGDVPSSIYKDNVTYDGVKCFIIEWSGYRWGVNQYGQISLQARLYEDGRIALVYQNFTNQGESSRSASAGISGPNANQFLSIRFKGFTTDHKNKALTPLADHQLLPEGEEESRNWTRPAGSESFIVHFVFTPVSTSIAAPSNLKVLRANNYKAHLSWNAAPDVESYAIYRKLQSSSDFVYQATVVGTTYIDPSILESSKSYIYQVYSLKGKKGNYAEATSSICSTGLTYLDGLQAHYKLDGNGRDETGDNPGILVGNPSYTKGSDNLFHSGLAFNGTSQYLTTANPIPSNLQSSPFTISFKFKASPTATRGRMVSFGDEQYGMSSKLAKDIFIDHNGLLSFGIKNGSNQLVYITTPAGIRYDNGQWYTVTATFSTTNGMKLYVNGVSKVTSTVNKSLTGFLGNGNWRVGFDMGDYYKGDLDELYIFNRELSSLEVDAIAKSAVTKTATYTDFSCVGASITLTGPSDGDSYAWTGPNNFTSTQRNSSFTMAPEKTGTYKLVVTKANSCIDIYYAEIPSYDDIAKALWTGNENSAFDNPENWCGGILPPVGLTRNIVKPSLLGNNPVINNATSVGKIKVNNEAILSVGSNGNLSVDDLEIVDGGNVKITGDGNLSINNLIINNGEIDAADGKVTFTTSTPVSISSGFFTLGSIKHLQLTNAAKITLTSPLALSGTLTALDNSELLSNSHLTIKATESSQGQIRPLSVGAKISGQVTVENFVAGGSQDPYRTYRMISSSVYDNGSALPSLRTYNVSQLHDDMIITGEGGSINGFDENIQNRPSAWTYEDNQYVPIPRINTNIGVGKGIYVYYRGDKTNLANKLYGPYPNVESRAMNFSGLLNQQDVVVNINNTSVSGYALLGNPYASPIGVKNLAKTNLGNTYWTFDPSVRNYVTYTDDIVVNSATDIIGVGQAFFVDIIGANATVTFKESDKVDGLPVAPSHVLESNSSAQQMAIDSFSMLSSLNTRNILRLEMKSLVSYGRDEIAVVFENGGDANYTNKDAEHWDGEQVNLSSLSADGKKLAINFMPELVGGGSIKLFAKAATSGNYIIQFNTSEYYSAQQIKLNDKYLGTSVLVFSGMNYQFAIDLSNPTTYGGDRFSLTFEPLEVLPVKLDNFVANKEGDRVKLSWKTVGEKLDDTFNVFRTDHGGFKAFLGTVKANNSLAYSLVDAKPSIGNNYYELLSANSSGEDKLLASTSVNFTIGAQNIIYPNPFKEILTVKVADIKPGSYTIQLVDLVGKRMMSETASAQKLRDGYVLNTIELNSGVYVVKVSPVGKGSYVFSGVMVKGD